tara:strand:- start:73 stop:291 length:219 start_codon:yes stop_codon:yes gene_type:complete
MPWGVFRIPLKAFPEGSVVSGDEMVRLIYKPVRLKDEIVSKKDEPVRIKHEQVLQKDQLVHVQDELVRKKGW